MKWIRALAYLFPRDKTKSEVATEQSLARDICSIISSAGDAGIPRSDIQGRLAMLGRSIRKHPNPTGIVNAVIDRLIASEDVVESNDSVTGEKVLKSRVGRGQTIMKTVGQESDEPQILVKCPNPELPTCGGMQTYSVRYLKSNPSFQFDCKSCGYNATVYLAERPELAEELKRLSQQ